MREFQTKIDETRISFCSPEKTMEKLQLTPGSVSIFGLLNNADKDIKIYIDSEISSEKMICFHPNDNTKTIFISIKDMYKFFNQLGYQYTEIDF